MTKKANFKKFVRRNDVGDNWEMDDALANVLPRDAEAGLDAPVMSQSNYDRDVLSTVKQAVGYDAHSPKIMRSMNLFTVSIVCK